MERKKRILIISDSIKRKTGYATVARNIIKRLIATGKYEIAQLGLADVPTPVELPIIYYSGVKVHNKCCNRGKLIEYVEKGDPQIKLLKMESGVPLHENQHTCIKGIPEGNDNYGYISVYFVVQHFRPDIVMPINDIWGLYNLVHLRNRRCFKFVPYIAIDSECMFPQLAIPNPNVPLPPVDPGLTVENADYPVVFTNWAKSVLNTLAKRTGKQEFTKMITIPHGVDTKIWKPLDNKKELRDKYFKLPPNAFLVGSVARNQPRKRLDGLLQAAKVFIDKYENDRKLFLYFHCAIEDRLGWPLPWLANYYGILDRCIFDKNLKPGVGPTDEQLNELVNCFDAHVMLTNSEGWCCLPNTNIMTPEGSKRIDSFNIGDKVITHKGNIKNISNVLTREYSGEMIRIETVGNIEGLSLTPNHNVLKLKQEKDTLSEEWIPSEELEVGDFVSLPSFRGTDDFTTKFNILEYLDMSTKTIIDGKIYPLIKNQTGLTNKPNTRYRGLEENIILDSEMCRFIGYYLAEGCSKDKRIRLSINASGDERIRSLTNTLFPNTKTEIYDRNRETLVICDTILSEWFESFGSNAHEKYIPEKLFETIYKYNKLSKEILNGLIEGDGSFIKKNSSLNFTTVSRRLAEQIRMLFLRNGIYAKIYRAKRGEYTVLVQGKQCIEECRTFIDKCGRWELQKNICRHKQAFNKLWFKITDIVIEEFTGTVYNLSVEDDESYIAEGVAVHNCLPALETAAAGIPNIITNYSAHADWGKGSLIMCKVAATEHEPRTGFIKAIADVNDCAKSMKLIAEGKKYAEEWSKKGVKLGKKLDWDNVAKMWEDLFDSIDVSDLSDGRYDEPFVANPAAQDFNLKFFPKEEERFNHELQEQI